jgi:glycosyltransferase involved in cell wall biosynthesis
VTVTVVLPVYNERENLTPSVARLLSDADQATDGSFELVFVDDGSRDGSAQMLDALSAEARRMKVVHLSLSLNFGHQAVVQAGLDETRARSTPGRGLSKIVTQ